MHLALWTRWRENRPHIPRKKVRRYLHYIGVINLKFVITDLSDKTVQSSKNAFKALVTPKTDGYVWPRYINRFVPELQGAELWCSGTNWAAGLQIPLWSNRWLLRHPEARGALLSSRNRAGWATDEAGAATDLPQQNHGPSPEHPGRATVHYGSLWVITELPRNVLAAFFPAEPRQRYMVHPGWDMDRPHDIKEGLGCLRSHGWIQRLRRFLSSCLLDAAEACCCRCCLISSIFCMSIRAWLVLSAICWQTVTALSTLDASLSQDETSF